MMMDGDKERHTSKGLKFFFNDGPAAQYLAPENKSVRELIEKRVSGRAASVATFAEREQSNGVRDAIDNSQNLASIRAPPAGMTVPAKPKPQGYKPSKGALGSPMLSAGEHEPQRGPPSSLHLNLQKHVSRHQAESRATNTRRDIVRDASVKPNSALSVQVPVPSDTMPGSAAKLMEMFTRPFKRSFDPPDASSHKRQNLNQGETSTPIHVNSYRKDKATLLNCTSVVNKKPANQVAASEIIYPVPTRDLAATPSRLNNNILSSQYSGLHSKESFLSPRKTSDEIQSQSHSSGESPDPLLGDSPLALPDFYSRNPAGESAQKMDGEPPKAVVQSPSRAPINKSLSSKSKIQVVIPLKPTLEDLPIIQTRSTNPEDVTAAATVNKHQTIHGALDRTSSTLSISNQSTTTPTAAASNNYSTIKSKQLSTNRNPNQANHPADESVVPLTASLTKLQQPLREVIDLTYRPSMQQAPQTKIIKAATNHNSTYVSPYSSASLNPWPAASASSVEIQGQQVERKMATPQGIQKPLAMLPQIHNGISGHNHSHSQKPSGQHPLSPKRKHSEIIDLTQDEVQPQKQPKSDVSGFPNVKQLGESLDNNTQERISMKAVTVGMAMAPVASQSGAPAYHLSQPPSIPPQQMVQHIHSQFYRPPQIQLHPHQANPNPYPAVYTGFTSGVILPDRFRNSPDIVKPLLYSSASNASYDPRSIARSILLATNSHPTEKGLNFHLQSLRRYTFVDEFSDLSTFRWDLVDPSPVVGDQRKSSGQQFLAMPPGPQRGYQQLPIHGSQPRHGSNALKTNATSDRPSAHHHVGISESLASIGSAIPSRPVNDSHTSQSGVAYVPPPRVPTPISAQKQSSTAIASQKGLPSNPGTPYISASRQQPASLSRIAVEIRSPAPLSSAASTTLKKRGRPFKKVEATAPVQSAPKKRGRPFRDPEAAAANKEITAAGPPKKRGRPFKLMQEMADIPLRDPKFLVFGCEWSGCSAELHSLEILRTHLATVHRKKQDFGDLVCLWGHCGKPSGNKLAKKQDTSIKAMKETNNSLNRKPMKEAIKFPKDYYVTVKDVRGSLEDNDVSSEETELMNAVDPPVRRFIFKDIKEWEAHIEKAHLVPYAWHMGDGPRETRLPYSAGTEKKQANPWLFDKDGNQVIDSVEGQQIEDGKPAENNDKRFKRVRNGIHVVLQPVKNPDAYKIYDYDDD